MANFVNVPHDRLASETLLSLLEEFASREGTEYGKREITLEEKVSRLHSQLVCGDIQLVYDADSEQWDLLDKQAAGELLND